MLMSFSELWPLVGFHLKDYFPGLKLYIVTNQDLLVALTPNNVMILSKHPSFYNHHVYRGLCLPVNFSV